ncbi:galactitol-1-phosphate 5-dehydrogenase [Draconibacterium halophilum]|uniref:Galactitol-1-phosphate 5-dehydrogenase n=1 Tax=Draconibacterium halophilum TaxID=2706887 RepID=A0A6C0R9J0_9BACT|nr:galactitol-1-phosphate 5-dehydrogenase [Draconibacterium halophilum]QIA06355.1 galactitol-1-phosphate 5-dehydrogenase [Draconibacterium halophilum]
MKALVLENYNELVYKDVADPVPAKNEVLVKVKACGICGSDVHGMDGSTGRRKPPLIMGHEASGIITSLGSEVSGWNIGDRVTFDSTIYPLNDWFTLNGHYNLSENRRVLGVSPGNYKKNGAFAEYVTVPEHILYKLPDNVTFEQAAMVEPAAVALHAINQSGFQLGESAAVIGTGMIGLFLVQLLSLSNASPLFAIDIESSKLEMAKEFGAEIGLNPNKNDLLKEVLARTNKRGINHVFEAVGTESTVNNAIEIVRKGGKVVLVGNLSADIRFPLQSVVTREIKVLGSCAIRGEYEKVLQLINSGKIKVNDMISAVAPLSAGADWFRRLYNKEPGLKKVILVP